MASRVEIELVSDRLAGARLAQAYAIAVPERRLRKERSDDDRDDHADVGQGSALVKVSLAGSLVSQGRRCSITRSPVPAAVAENMRTSQWLPPV